MLLLESDGHGKVGDYPRMLGEVCNGCESEFTAEDSFEALVDRLSKRGYLIHTSCFDALEAKLKGGNNGNLPAWAQL